MSHPDPTYDPTEDPSERKRNYSAKYAEVNKKKAMAKKMQKAGINPIIHRLNKQGRKLEGWSHSAPKFLKPF